MLCISDLKAEHISFTDHGLPDETSTYKPVAYTQIKHPKWTDPEEPVMFGVGAAPPTKGDNAELKAWIKSADTGYVCSNGANDPYDIVRISFGIANPKIKPVFKNINTAFEDFVMATMDPAETAIEVRKPFDTDNNAISSYFSASVKTRYNTKQTDLIQEGEIVIDDRATILTAQWDHSTNQPLRKKGKYVFVNEGLASLQKGAKVYPMITFGMLKLHKEKKEVFTDIVLCNCLVFPLEFCKALAPYTPEERPVVVCDLKRMYDIETTAPSKKPKHA